MEEVVVEGIKVGVVVVGRVLVFVVGFGRVM